MTTASSVAARAVVVGVLLVAVTVVAVAVLLLQGLVAVRALAARVVAHLERRLAGAVLNVHPADLAVRTIQNAVCVVRKGERARCQQTGGGNRHHNSSLLQHSGSLLFTSDRIGARPPWMPAMIGEPSLAFANVADRFSDVYPGGLFGALFRS